MRSIQFTIPGEAKGKGRPKFARMGNFVKTYTPEATASYENLVKIYFDTNFVGHKPFTGALKLRIAVHTAIPKSFSKKKYQQAINGVLRPTKKPDADNIIKIIADSLNGIAYIDDKQIVDITYSKYYAEQAQVVVRITPIDVILLLDEHKAN